MPPALESRITPNLGWRVEEFTKMCSGSEAGSYLRLIDFVYHSTLGLRVIKKKKVGNTPRLGDGALCLVGLCLPGRHHLQREICKLARLYQKMLKGHLPRVVYHQVY